MEREGEDVDSPFPHPSFFHLTRKTRIMVSGISVMERSLTSSVSGLHPYQ